MSNDAFWGLLKRRLTIDLPNTDRLGHAQRLKALGLLDIERREYVCCVNPEDHDQRYLKDRDCSGRIYLSPDIDEDNHDYQCPDCGRVVFPQRKCHAECVVLTPDKNAIQGYTANLMGCLGCNIEEKPLGILRARTDKGEVQVCLVDWCWDQAALSPGYAHASTTLYVVIDDRTYARRVPAGAETFRMVDLALTDASKRFQRRLRSLAKLDGAGTAAGPAVLSMPIPIPPPYQQTPPQKGDDGIIRIPVPPGTTWSQIQLYLVDGETVAIRVPGKEMARYAHIQLGMANKRNNNPTKKWELIQALCEKGGSCEWGDVSPSFSAFTTLVSDARDSLQVIFGIDTDPFSECSKTNGLRAEFQAFPDIPNDPYVGEKEWL